MFEWLKKLFGVKAGELKTDDVKIEEVEEKILTEEEKKAVYFFTEMFVEYARKAKNEKDRQYLEEVAQLLKSIFDHLEARMETSIDIWGNPNTNLGAFYWAILMEGNLQIALKQHARQITNNEMEILCEGIAPAKIIIQEVSPDSFLDSGGG